MLNLEQIAQKIAINFYEKSTSVEKISQGKNTVFAIHLGETRKILKLFAAENQQLAKTELIMIKFLAQNSIPVPVAEYNDINGNLVGLPFLITADAGRETILTSMKSGDIAHQYFTEMGTILARIHQLDLSLLEEAVLAKSEAMISPAYLEQLYQKVDWLKQQAILSAEEVEKFKALPIPNVAGNSLCHSDFHAVQCVVNQGKISAVLDWESPYIGNPAIDLSITHTYLDTYSRWDLIKSFFTGYTSILPLPDDYAYGYLPIRMAHVLSLLFLWSKQNQATNVKRLQELFRAYCKRC